MTRVMGAKIEHSDAKGLPQGWVGSRFRYPCLVHKERRINDPGFGGKN